MKTLFSLIFILVTASFSFAATATLNWSDNSDNEANFVVERNLNNGLFLTIATVGPSVTSYVDSTLVAGSVANTYCYTVFASNSAGSSARTNQVCATIPAISTVPAAPSNLTIK